MPRRARRSAGAEVAASAEGYSDETLELEEQAFDRIDAVFAELAEQVAEELRAAESVERGAPVWPLIALLIAGTAAEVDLILDELLAATIALALASIAFELGAIEDTLDDDFDGVAAVAVSIVSAEQLLADLHDRVADEIDGHLARAQSEVEWAQQRWSRSDEDRDALVDRLTGERVRRPGQSGRGIVRRPSTGLQQLARRESIGSTSDARIAVMDQFNVQGMQRGLTAPLIRKQVLATIDNRTTVVCLHAAGQIRDIDEPFDTLNGPLQRPPFHWGCRSQPIPYARGMAQRHRAEANAELMNRPRAERRLGPGGEVGGRVPGVPPVQPEEPLPDDLAAQPELPIEDVPIEHRLAYMRAFPERFSTHPNGPRSAWVRDGDRRWNLRV